MDFIMTFSCMHRIYRIFTLLFSVVPSPYTPMHPITLPLPERYSFYFFCLLCYGGSANFFSLAYITWVKVYLWEHALLTSGYTSEGNVSLSPSE